METYYYSTATGQTYSDYQMQSLFGINVETTDLSILNLNGFYPVQPTSPDFDTKLYNPTFVWTLVPIPGGQGAERTYTANAKPLPEAKENAGIQLKQKANQDTANIVALSYLSTDTLTSVASQDPLTRSPFIQDTLDAMDAVSVSLGDNLALVDAATNVDTLNNIVHQPYGTIMTGRGAPGQAGPLDLNLSYFTAIEDLGFPESALELYIPGTDTVIPYTDSLPEPYHFDSMGNCFADGDWRMVIRMADSGAVLSTITVSEGVDIPVDWTYNPVIPGLGGGSHHEAF